MKLRGIILLLIAAMFWGFAFCVQSIGGKEIGAYSFNSLRMLFGALFMLLFIKIFDKKGFSSNKQVTKEDKKRLWKFGIVCGILLTIASNLQQVALNFGAEAGRAGFLTAIYIIIVPIIGIFIGKKFGINLWISVVIALAGLYFLCISGSFKIAAADILLILCAVAFAFHICTIDLSDGVDALRLSAIQFLVCGILSFILASIFEIAPIDGGILQWARFFATPSFWIMILYMAIFSGCVGYTLQIIGQRDLSPPVASLIMCMESVFSVVFGYLVLGEELTVRQLAGCGMILISIIIAQLNFKKKCT